jgi:hypothetical protein
MRGGRGKKHLAAFVIIIGPFHFPFDALSRERRNLKNMDCDRLLF